MIRPSPKELLEGIADVLRESVSKELPNGETRNQVRAAAAIARRLAEVWDQVVPALEAENRDIDETLGSLAGALSELGLVPISSETQVAEPSSSPFERAAARNLELQEYLTEIHSALRACEDEGVRGEVEVALRALHQRNLARDRELSRR